MNDAVCCKLFATDIPILDKKWNVAGCVPRALR